MNQKELFNSKYIDTLEARLYVAKAFIESKCTCKLWNSRHPSYHSCEACIVFALMEPKENAIDSYCGAV